MQQDKITDLPELATAAADDVLEITDVSAGTSNKVQAQNLASAVVGGMADGAITSNLLGDTGWTSVSLNSGFTGTFQIRRIGDVVYTRGLVTRTAGPFPTSYQTVATIPAGYRTTVQLRFTHSTYPSGAASTYLVTFGTDGVVTVASNGSVQGDQVYLNDSWLLG